MPTRRRHFGPRRREAAFSGGHRTHLEAGCVFFDNEVGYDLPAEQEQMRREWQRYGEQITREYAAEYPGCRPWAWWKYTPNLPETPEFAGLFDVFVRGKRLSQRAYLEQHNLLQPEETNGEG